MKSSLIAGILVSLAVPFVACGGTVIVGPSEASPPAADASTPPTTSIDDAGTDASTSVVCGAKVVDPKCTTTKPAPTSSAEIAKFVKDNAIPLRCSSGTTALWDLQPLVDLYGAQKMFMIGEVHGSNEIGIVSSLVFDELASKKLVNVVGFEIPADFEDALQRYVDTGSDPTANQLLGYFAKNFFGSILTKQARAQKAKGNPITVAAVDIPQDPSYASSAIQQIASKLTTHQSDVLTGLPTSPSLPPSPADVQAVKSYFDGIMAKKVAICSELSADDCDRLDAMTHALWAATLADDVEGRSELWFTRREVFIYYAMHAKMTKPTDRMFLHMGAAHTNKSDFSAGSRMSKEWPQTKGQVFSVAPAYGASSVIWYGGDTPVDPEPQTIVSALGDKPANPFFVATNRPSSACVANPVGVEPEDRVGVGGNRGDLYDGYIHYGRLTSERRPSDATLSREDASGKDATGAGADAKIVARIRRLEEFRARVVANEKSALAARAAASR